MDKFITFIGYIQNYVAPSRRNERSQPSENSSTKRKQVKGQDHLLQDEIRAKETPNIGKDSTSRGGLNSHNGGTSNEKFEEAGASTELDGKIFRGKVREGRYQRTEYKMFVQNEQAKRSADADIESCRSEAALPPVETAFKNNSNAAQNITISGVRAAQGEMSAASPEKLNQSAGNRRTYYPGYTAAPHSSHEQKTNQYKYQTKEDQGATNLPGGNGLPDIYSTEGKPLVQLKQRSVPYTPVGRKPTCVVADTLSVKQVDEDWVPQNKVNRKPRLNLPKLKERSKKENKKVRDLPSKSPLEQDGNVIEEDSRNPSEKSEKLDNTVSRSGAKEDGKLSEEKAVEAESSHIVINKAKPTRRRPGTALGRWIKKRSNSVAPAPLDDLTCDSCGHDLLPVNKETLDNNTSNTTDERDTLRVEQLNDDLIFPQNANRKSRLKLTKLKKKSKKEKKEVRDLPSKSPLEQDGNVIEQESRNPPEKSEKLDNTVSRCGAEDDGKLSEEKAVEAESSNRLISKSKPTRRRQGTALGRWIKKRSNSVTPAPLDDLTCDSCGHDLLQLNKETLHSDTSNTTDGRDTLSVVQLNDDWIFPEKANRKSRLKLTKLRKKSKKNKKEVRDLPSKSPLEQDGNVIEQDSRNPSEKSEKLDNTVSRCGAEEDGKLSVEKAVEAESSNRLISKTKPTCHRQGTALGRWIKKRSKSVTPAPLDDLTCDSCVHDLLQVNKETLHSDTSNTTDGRDTLSVVQLNDDWIFPEKANRKSRLKLTKLRKKSKKNKKEVRDLPSKSPLEQDGNVIEQDSRNPSEKSKKLDNTVSRCGTEEDGKLSVEKAVEAESGNRLISKTKPTCHRQGTALGSWIKKRSNSVTPAPLDDLTCDSCDLFQINKDNITSNTTDEKIKTCKNDVPVAPRCRTILVTEKNRENVSVLTMRKNTNNEQECSATKDDVVKKMAKAETASTTEYKKKGGEMSTPSSDKVEKELQAVNKSCGAPTNPKHDPTAFVRGRKNDQWSLQSVSTESGENLDRKKKQLITLEMKSGLLETPIVSKTNYGSVSFKSASVKQRATKSSASHAQETEPEEQGSSMTERERHEWRFDDPESLQREVKSKVGEQPMKKRLKQKKKVSFNLEQGAVGGAPDTAVHSAMYFTGHHRPAVRKPKTFLQQFQALTSNDCSTGPSNELPPPVPDCKPKWHGGGPCLPSILPDKKRRVEDFLTKHRKKKELEQDDDFESWGEPEPEEVKRILERPITAKPPRYPEHWGPLSNERPPERGGQGFCLGIIWKKTERSFLSDSSSEDLSELANQEEEPDVFPGRTEHFETPRKGVFSVDYSLPACDQREDAVSWCKATRVRKPCPKYTLSRRHTEDKVDLEDVE